MFFWVVPALNLVTYLEMCLWEVYPVLIWRLTEVMNHCAWKSSAVPSLVLPISFIKADLLVLAVPFDYVSESAGCSAFSLWTYRLQRASSSLLWQTELSSQASRNWKSNMLDEKSCGCMMHWSGLNTLLSFKFALKFLIAYIRTYRLCLFV